MYKKLVLIVLLLLVSVPLAAELPHGMGLIPMDPEKEAMLLEEADIDITRDRADSVDHSPYMPPVGNQGQVGSCVAWAWAYYYKSYQELVDHDYWDNTDSAHIFNPMYMYNHINGGNDGGAYQSDGIACLQQLGASPYTSCNIPSTDYTSWPNEKAYNDAIVYRGNIGYYINTNDNSGIEALKQHIDNGNDNATISITVWPNYMYNNLGPNHIYDNGDASGTNLGGHANCIVGYNDSLVTPDGKGAFRVVNSWGTGWGDNGYYWITYEAMQNGSICTSTRAYYCTDKIDYKPTTKGVYKISHNHRQDIQISFQIPFQWSSNSFFSFSMGVKANRAYPNNPIVLDISGIEDDISAFEMDSILLKARDTDNDGQTGTVEEYSIVKSEWGIATYSLETPVNMSDYGYTDVKLDFPDGISYWQSFQRDPAGTGYSDFSSANVESTEVSWTFPTADSVISSPIMSDINEDGYMEIIVGSNDQTLYAIDYEGNEEWIYITGGRILGAPATADLDKDGILEVIVGSDNQQIACLNGTDGSEDWTYTTFMSGLTSSPTIANIDSDGELEVIGAGTFLRVLHGEDGTSSWMHYNGTPSKSSPSAGDFVDNDGINDVLLGQGTYTRVFDGEDGSIVGQINTGGTVNSSPAIGDLDGDDLMEAVFGSDNDTVYAVQYADDSIIWKFGTGGAVSSSPAIADIDGDNNLEVVFGSHDGTVYALNGEDGSLYGSYATGGAVMSSPALADLDGDGNPDVVVGSTDGILYGISSTMTSAIWQLDLGTSIKSSPAVGDIDMDDELEIAVGGGNGNVYLICRKGQGIEDNDISYGLYLASFDSPVRGKTSIEYSIPSRSHVNLSLFDLSGRRVRGLVDGMKEAGSHEVTLNTNGLANGIYFCRLSTDYNSTSRKVVLIK